MKIAVFPGSFDPFTLGHESIVRRALGLFDKIIIAIGVNEYKKGFFSVNQRQQWIAEIFKDEPKVEVEVYYSLTVQFCRKVGAKYILRGLRTSADFEYERLIGQINKDLQWDIETVYLLTLPEHTHISSSMVKEIIKYKGDVSKFLPPNIAKEIMQKYWL